jgi:hypothetical protein
MRIAHRHLDRLIAEHLLDLRPIQSRLDQPRSCRMPQVMKTDIWQPCSQDCASAGFIDGAIPMDSVASALYFTRLQDGCQALCERHRPCLMAFV